MSIVKKIRGDHSSQKSSSHDDSVALKTNWDPARPGGSNIKTHKMIRNDDRIVIKKSAGSYIFWIFFSLPGALMVFPGSIYLMMTGNPIGMIVSLAFGYFWCAFGLSQLTSKSNITLDRKVGVYFTGKELKKLIRVNRQFQGRIADIHALQIIDELNSLRNGKSYYSYELNLIFKDGERSNIMDHADEAHIEQCARQLSDFLDVPVWRLKK